MTENQPPETVETVTEHEAKKVTTVRSLSFLDSAGGHIMVGFGLLFVTVGLFLIVDMLAPAEDIKGGLLVIAGNVGGIVINVFKRALDKAGDDQ